MKLTSEELKELHKHEERKDRLHTVLADLNEQAADRLDLIIRQMMKTDN